VQQKVQQQLMATSMDEAPKPNEHQRKGQKVAFSQESGGKTNAAPHNFF